MHKHTNNLKDYFLTGASEGMMAQEQQACWDMRDALTNLANDAGYSKAAHWSWEDK